MPTMRPLCPPLCSPLGSTNWPPGEMPPDTPGVDSEQALRHAEDYLQLSAERVCEPSREADSAVLSAMRPKRVKTKKGMIMRDPCC